MGEPVTGETSAAFGGARAVKLTRRHLLMAGAMATLAGCNVLPGGRATLTVDRSVSTVSGLEAVFEDLSPGQTVYIEDTGSPYRTTQWLDVDVDGVTVLGPGIRRLIEPADGANVGGIRIGNNAHCENVTVSGIGYNGNPGGQRKGAWRLHGIVVRDAENVTIEGNFVTKTHPYHRHNYGGSGISAERQCSNVRVANNRITDIGDRGIQLAGEGITVVGNVVTDGFDRSIACDAWSPDAQDYQARNVTITGNVLGNNEMGSLTGVAGGTTDQPDRGYIDVIGNVGFGPHKSLCHVGGEGETTTINVQGNVAVQNATNRIGGVVVDMERVRNVTVKGNHLVGYDGPGVNLEGDVADFLVANNSIESPGETGIRIAGARDGTVTDNQLTDVPIDGILLDGAQHVAVTGNRIEGAARSGIVVRNGAYANDDLAGNVVRDYNRSGTGAPAILIQDMGHTVRGNRVATNGAPAIAETLGAAENLYLANRADGDSPWTVTSPTSIVKNHVPGFDVHRGLTDGDGDGVVRVRFAKPYVERPKLEFGRVGGGIQGVEYVTDDGGFYVAATLTIGTAGGTLDVFVEGV